MIVRPSFPSGAPRRTITRLVWPGLRWRRSLALCLLSLLPILLSALQARGAALPDPAEASARLQQTTTVVYQQGVSPAPDYAGVSDAFISRAGDEENNYGGEATLALRSGDLRAALLRFDLTGLPAGDVVEQATLSLFVTGYATSTTTLPVSVYGVLRPWVDRETTWYNASTSELWTLAGCNGPGADRAVSPSAFGVIAGAGVWINFDLTSLAQAWVDSPESNLGVVIKAGSSISRPAPVAEEGEAASAMPTLLAALAQHSGEYLIASSEYTDVMERRPKLALTTAPASAGSPTPTPTTIYASPTAVVFQQLLNPSPAYTGTTDTFISDYGDMDRNYGSDAVLRLRSNDHRASLLRFDLLAIPSNARVHTATLELYTQSRTNANPLPVNVHRMLRPWVDIEATWMLAAIGKRWAFPGANGLTTDRSPIAFATGTLNATAAWTRWDVTALAQDWVADPESNYGVIFKAGSGTQVEYSLISSHFLGNPSQRPKLTIDYALPVGVTPVPVATRTHTATTTPSRTPQATPTIVTFQAGLRPSPGYVQVADAHLSRAGDLTTNYGADPVLTVGADDVQAALLRFDLTTIPPWATVHSARLALLTDGAGNGYPLRISAYQILRPWVDMQATWINALANVPWAVGGANGAGIDRLESAADALLVSTLGDWYEFDVTAMARSWVATPDDNYGLVLKGMPGHQVSYDFRSSQYQGVQGASFRPRLTVAYSLPPGPTPTASRTRTPSPTATRAFIRFPVILAAFTSPEIPTPTLSPTLAPTDTPSATPTWTQTQTPHVTATATHTATQSTTPSATPMPATLVFRQGVSPLPGYGGASDTYISDYGVGDETTNFGGVSFLSVRAIGRSAALLRFDVSSIPLTATVLAASLSLSVEGRSDAAPLPVAAHALLRPWAANEATWRQAAAGVDWAGPGAQGAQDRGGQPVAGQTFAAVDAWYDLDLRAIVQAWVTDPAANYGILLASLDGGDVEYRLRSAEATSESLRPKLVVTYLP